MNKQSVFEKTDVLHHWIEASVLLLKELASSYPRSMFRYTCAWVFVIHMVQPLTLAAQNYKFKLRSVTYEQGLVNRNITTFFEDEQGFIWMGSPTGLNKYNAHRLISYKSLSGHLINNNVEQITQDHHGLLWLLGRDLKNNNQTDIQVFDPVSEKSTTLENHLGAPLMFDPKEVVSIASYQHQKALWIVLKNGTVFVYRPSGLDRVEYENPFANGSNLMSLAGPNSVWIFNTEGIIQLNQNGTTAWIKKPEDVFDHTPLTVDEQGDIYYLSAFPNEYGGLYQVLSKNFETVGNAATDFWATHRFAAFNPVDQTIWLNKYNKGQWTEDFIVYNQDLEEVHKMKIKTDFFSYPKFPYFDSRGLGWANHDDGVNIISIKRSKFRNYLTEELAYGLDGYGSRGLYVDEHSDVMYTNGLGRSYKVDLKTGKKTEFGPTGDFYRNLEDDALFKRLALIKARDSNLWYSDENVRIAKYDTKSGRFTDYSYFKNSLNLQSEISEEMRLAWALHEDSNGKLWLGRRNGLGYLDARDSALKSFDNYQEYQELASSSVFTFYENDRGIWIGGMTGLYLMTPEGKILTRFHQKGKPGNYLPAHSIVHIREDEEGHLWLASRGGGILRVNTDTGAYQQWTSAQGLSDDVVYATFEDDHGHIWASSNNGIMRIKKSGMAVSTYLESDGLPHNEFNTTSYYQTTEGRIFFGGLDGITSFAPGDFLTSEGQPQLRLIKLEKQTRSDGLYSNRSENMFKTNEILLNPNELGFKLEMSLLDYEGADDNQYAFKIEGMDADWNYLSEPLLRINALPYGSYLLHLKGQGLHGQWSEELLIPVNVKAPFYLRWWFFAMAALVIGLAVFAMFRYRLKNLERIQARLEQEVKIRTQKITEQSEELREMDRIKSRFFANVSHELRTPLTLILGPVANLLKSSHHSTELKKELQLIQRNGRNMHNLVEEILDLSKLDAKKIKITEHVTLVQEYFEILFQNFQSQANHQNTDYQYAFNGDKQLSVLLDQRLVERIVTNLLSNAFKFTSRSGSISLIVTEREESLRIEVRDNGMGISTKDLPHIFDRFFQTKDTNKPVQGGTGIGLATSRELAQLLGGKLEVHSQLNQGTVFTLTLPKNVHERQGVSFKNPHRGSLDVADEDITVPVDTRKTKLLLVEDNIDMQRFIVDSLNDYHRVDVKNNGKEGVEFLLQGDLPDIIISDLMMPEMNGLEFLKKIKQNPETKDIPLLMLTARSAEEDKLEAFTLGVDDYLLKPFSVEELKARLKNLLKNSKSRKLAKATDSSDEHPEDSIYAREKEWLKKLKALTQENVHRVDFNIASVAGKLDLSERQFQRNLKKITGLTPSVYMKEIRLQMAREYLEKRTYLQVKDVALAVGFTSTPYFSKQFQERFGKKPGEYLEFKYLSIPKPDQ